MNPKQQQITNGKLTNKSSFISSFAKATRQLVRGFVTLFDRSNPTTKSLQDVGINLSLFVGAIFAMHRYGTKLAV